ncbi:ankyrin repeat and SOCS box protein 8-like isoform X1 [Branchiostoma floridae]|uniref:Ankyrin repeat and SOCS box protein 8-like isoform X1 n=1 Tax=Branchiostoma floridae TaxID=7739 RepID=A0A9J7LHQ6_BRAFL|nr:ankyrin repeat and SOCS box protein 8-like isoform X1 [Branchiostoma floridae]
MPSAHVTRHPFHMLLQFSSNGVQTRSDMERKSLEPWFRQHVSTRVSSNDVAEIPSENEALLVAAMNGSFRGVEAALKAGADIDFYNLFSNVTKHPHVPACPALHITCLLGHVDIVRLLLRKGAWVAHRDAATSSALHRAVAKGSTEIVDLLVQHGATVDTQDVHKNTPLVVAVSYNHVDTVRRLIELGARPDLDHCPLFKTLKEDAKNRARVEESLKLVEEAKKTKLLRCCNPKCGKPGERKTGTLKLCAGCKLTRYCSRDCQIQHWSVGHKKCCQYDVYTEETADIYRKMSLLTVLFQVHPSQV